MRQRKNCDTEKLIREYKAGKPIAELEKEFKICNKTIYRRLNEAGCTLKTMKQREGEVGCPCFRAVVLSSVKCEAGEEWNHLSLNFDSAQDGKEFRQQFCLSDNYVNCRLFKHFEDSE